MVKNKKFIIMLNTRGLDIDAELIKNNNIKN